MAVKMERERERSIKCVAPIIACDNGFNLLAVKVYLLSLETC